MSPGLLATVGVCIAVGGVVGLITIIRRGDADAAPPSRLDQMRKKIVAAPSGTSHVRRDRAIIAGAAAAALVLAWLYTGIPMVGIVLAAIIAGGPWLFGAGRAEKKMLARLEALQQWTSRIKDIVRTGKALNEAIVLSSYDAPAALAPELSALAAAVRSGSSTESALRQFADSLDDATVDEVVIALVVNSRERGPKLGEVLDRLGTAIGNTITMRREVAASRVDARMSGWVLSAVTIAGLLLLLVNKSYTQPYHTLIGQILLGCCVAAFAGLLVWMRALNMPRRVPRLLAPFTTRGGAR